MVILIILLALPAVFGAPSGNHKIVGGTPSDILYAPYQVSVQLSGFHFCGGSILTKKLILTAAHCLEGDPPSYISIRAGSSRIESGGQFRKAEAIIIHEKYDPKTFDSDMAIIVLEEELEFNTKVQPIELASSEEDIPTGGYALVTGWGALGENEEEDPEVLMELLVPIISSEECQEIYPKKYTKNMLCAGYLEGGKDSCQGDSGGPLVYNDKLIGVVSWGIGCARPNRPGLYSHVVNMRSWVVSTMNTITLGSHKIVGGVDVTIEQYPYQLSLEYFGLHRCGASLISRKFVVTAAHCTEDRPAEFLTIRAGTSIRNYGGQILQVKRVIDHPQYDVNTIDYDISILELENPVEYTQNIQPIDLIEENVPIKPGTMMTVTGWGLIGEDSEPASNLQKVEVPMLSFQDCLTFYGDGFTERMMCAGYAAGGKDSCQGDSGGPLVVNNKLVGVVSWGDGCGQPNQPGVYANVSVLRRFILENSGV